MRILQSDERAAFGHLELDQQLPGKHVAVLLIVGKGHIRRHRDPAVKVAVEHSGAPFLASIIS